jgi:hypothetical protein
MRLSLVKLIIVLLTLLNFNANSQVNNIIPGFYNTVKDYDLKNITNAGTFGANDMNKVIFEKDGKKTVYPCRDLTEWGFHDNKGYDWRIFNKQAYVIIETGKIIVYHKGILDINKKDSTDVICDAEQIYFSSGYDGEITGFFFGRKETINKVAEWIRKYDSELADKFESENFSFFPKNVKTIFEYVKMLNDKFEKKSTPRIDYKIKVTPN